MGPFANAVNAAIAFHHSLPQHFCITASSQAAFTNLNNVVDNMENLIKRGENIFEINLQTVFNEAMPLLNEIKNTSNIINASSRDFTAAMNAAQRYIIITPIQQDIWEMTPKIQSMNEQWITLSNDATAAFKKALAQIETNVTAEAQMFSSQNTAAEAAFTYWDTVDGKQGYKKYADIANYVSQVLVPDFNAFISKVPGTDNVNNAVAQVQQAINHIDSGFDSFPDFKPLPPDTTTFPHVPYGSAEKQYGEDKLIAALISVATAYNQRTGKKLLIGNMQWEHGGYMSPHVSHKNGLDADIVGSDVGIVPNDDAVKALALAKELLSAGASLVLFGDQEVITDADKWATDNHISGHLSYDAGHKDHFHIRMPI
jgi:Penicillin-insensitive murein endopeptidase